MFYLLAGFTLLLALFLVTLPVSPVRKALARMYPTLLRRRILPDAHSGNQTDFLRYLLASAVYVSSDEVERFDARQGGYRKICQHPGAIGTLDTVRLLVVDFNQILFGDDKQAIDIVVSAARRGILIGIYTYTPDSPKLAVLATLPNVVVAKNHCRLLDDIRRYGQRRSNKGWKIAKTAKPVKKTTMKTVK